MESRVTDLVQGMKDLRPATVPVLVCGTLAAAIYVFFQIAGELGDEGLAEFDRRVLLALRNPDDLSDPLGPLWFQNTVREITTLGGYPVLVALVVGVAGFLLVARKAGPALYLLVSVSLGTLVGHLLKLFYERSRPDVVDHLVLTYTPSFPSGHATMSTVVFLTLAALVMRLVDRVSVRVYVLVVAVLVAFVVGMSRIYLGVHWPSDVAAGWALGTAWACLSWLTVSALRHLRSRAATQA